MMNQEMRHTISVLVENESGVLARIAGLFSGRGFNIESLSVAETLDPRVSRMTILTRGDDKVMDQITKQLNRLVCTMKVQDFKDMKTVDREMVLIKLAADDKTRAHVMNLVDIFRGKVVDVGPESYIIELTGDAEKIEAVLELFKPIGICEIVRTGRVAISRGMRNLSA
jgi:acetolactate synthase-1/3 small subunit